MKRQPDFDGDERTFQAAAAERDEGGPLTNPENYDWCRDGPRIKGTECQYCKGRHEGYSDLRGQSAQSSLL